jgi:hypothetical protein
MSYLVGFSRPSYRMTSLPPEGFHSSCEPADQQPDHPQRKRPRQFSLHARFRNINRMSIDYGFCPRLRPDLPAADEPGCRNLRLSVDGILTRLLATYACIRTCVQSTAAYATASTRTQRSSTKQKTPCDAFASHASVDGLSPLTLSAQNHIRPVSCYALFKWWLLLSQHPGCLRDSTSFYT